MAAKKAHAHSPKGDEKIQIQELMQPKARRDAAGITGLSDGELLSLNQWINEHRQLLGPRHTDDPIPPVPPNA